MRTQTGSGQAIEAAMAPLTLCQLRHHTRNTLQRVLMEVHEHSAACAAPQEQRLLSAVTDRIMHSVAIADALFGVTRAQAPFPDRLRAMCRSTVALLASTEQNLTTEIAIEGACPGVFETPVLRAAQEFVANAVKHGMRMRLMGRIALRLAGEPRGGVTLTVRDDGWGPCPSSASGEGLSLVRDVAELLHGTLALTREREETVARLVLPAPRHG